MDLVASIRKEGSRGGRDAFKWTDVKDSSHRENFLGHSIMAPVGRWQKGRDLNWYARSRDNESESATNQAKIEREEELCRIKEAEQEAMARALGLPVTPKTTNANMTPLGGKEVEKAIQQTTGEDDEQEGGRGIGFGSYGGTMTTGGNEERLEAIGIESDAHIARRARSRSPHCELKRERSRDRARDRNRKRRRHRHDHDLERYRHGRKHRSRSRSQGRDRDRDHEQRRDPERSHHRRRTPSRDRNTGKRHQDYHGRERRRERKRSPENHRDHRYREQSRNSNYNR